MAEPLDSIIAAVTGREYEVSGHMWENFLTQDDRPHPRAVARALEADDPVILKHQRHNPRGSACWIKAFNGSGRELFISVGYAERPMTLITAYYVRPTELEDDGDEQEAEETSPGL